jgi:ATP-binding cassette subfamily F protein 3
LPDSHLPLQRQHFTYVDPVVTAYISGLVEDEDEPVDDILEQTKGMLEDATVDENELNAL